MSSPSVARERILGAVRDALGKPARRSSIGKQPVPGAVEPSDDVEAVIEQFMLHAREESATTERVAEIAAVPAAVRQYLASQSLAPRVIVTDNARPPAIDWPSAEGLELGSGPIGADGDTVVTGCYAGVAEAGAVVTLSAREHPSEYNFLAATHIVLIPESRIVESFEQLWMRLHVDCAGSWPRMMNFIVGPSRTADLGVPSRLGAHGPSRVHILVARD